MSISSFDISTVQAGSVSYNGDGTFSYSPPDDFEGNDSFDYIVSDGRGGSATATVFLAVTQPVLRDDDRFLAFLNQTSPLFDENAKTNDQKNKTGIKAEYAELFNTTSNRNIKIRNIQWKMNNEKARGDAKFTVTVQPRGSTDRAQIEGKIEILAVKQDRGVFIKQLLHEVTAQ